MDAVWHHEHEILDIVEQDGVQQIAVEAVVLQRAAAFDLDDRSPAISLPVDEEGSDVGTGPRELLPRAGPFGFPARQFVLEQRGDSTPVDPATAPQPGDRRLDPAKRMRDLFDVDRQLTVVGNGSARDHPLQARRRSTSTTIPT